MILPDNQRTTAEKLSDFVLRTEPLWPVPLYFLLVYNSPYFWAGWILALLPWPLRLWRKGYLLPRTLFNIPILIFVIGLVVGLIFSDHRLLSLEAFQSYICVLLFYYALADGQWSRDWKLWGAFWALLFLLISVFILSQVPPDTSLTLVTPLNNWIIERLPSMPEIFDFTVNINGLAETLSVIIPVLFGVSIFGIKSHSKIRIIASLFAVIFLFLLAITISRGGWIAAGTALFVILLWRSKWALLAVPIIAGIMIWIWQAGYDLSHILQLNSSSDVYRIRIWETSIRMLKNYPLLGCGLGAFPAVFLPYAQANFTVTVQNPHSAYLMLYSDTGVIGALASAFGFIILIITVIKLWKAPKNQPAYGIAVGLVASVIALGTHGVFESSSAIIWTDGNGNYHYLASILPWLVIGALVAVMKKIKTEQEPVESD